LSQSKEQKIIFVTGKGGVGKSAVALALAKKHSISKRVLLVELGMRSFYSDFLGISVNYKPSTWIKNLDLALWSGSECLKEYALYLLKVESLYKLFFENRISKALIEVAPALSELAILGKITSGVRHVGPELEYDLIVVDAYATGHMLALLRAPRGMNESIQFGPMAEQTQSMLKTICNPEICQYVIVTLPEELPAVEADELHRELKKETGIESKIYCNKVWPQEEILNLKKESETTKGHEAEIQFTRDLSDLAGRQQAWIRYLDHRHSKVLQIPMKFSSDPVLIIESIERSLE